MDDTKRGQTGAVLRGGLLTSCSADFLCSLLVFCSNSSSRSSICLSAHNTKHSSGCC